jgi:membrane protein YqaA with SNARE-associated domain
MNNFLKKIELEADKKYVLFVLGAVSFLESIIFPVPVDIFTFSLAAVQPKKWFRFGLVATVWSVLGAILGYLLGYHLFDLFGQKLIDFYGYQDQFNQVLQLFNKNTFVVMFTSAFTPIPFKVFTIAGGAMKVSIFPFVFASLLGRGLRFFLEVYLAQKFGKQITIHVMKKINFYSIVFVFIVVLYFVLF